MLRYREPLPLILFSRGWRSGKMWKTQAGKGTHAHIWLWVYTKHRWPKCARKLSLLIVLNLSAYWPKFVIFPEWWFHYSWLPVCFSHQPQHPPEWELPPPSLSPSSPFLRVLMCRISDLGQSSEVRFLSFSVPLTLPFLRPLLCNSDDSAGTGPACWFIQMHLASAELCQTRSNKWMCS